ncbi:MAG: tol-pal system protein YbgF [Bradyrhizobiaceae bacterium]|nr:tol-pal system protein YbgF [Bradyrhizobiaceae bacterium]
MTRIATGTLALAVFSNLALFAAAPAYAQASASDVMVRLDQLESQIRQLTGTVEQLQYRNQQLEQALRRVLESQQLGGPGAPTASARPSSPPMASVPPPAPQPYAGEAPRGGQQPGAPLDLSTAGSTGRRGDAFDPTQNPNAAGAPRSLGSLPNTGAPPVGAGPYGAGPAANYQVPSATGGQTAAVSPPSQSPRDEYDLAYGYLLRKDYALAEDSFRMFLRTNPTDPHAADAQFWLGESLFQQQNYHDAADAFLTVSKKYEASSKAPDALLRLGQSLAAMGQKDLACSTFGEVGVKYPRATLNVRQSVEREQKRVHC